MKLPEMLFGAWGWLPIVVPAIVFIAVRLGSIAFPDCAAHRAVAGATLTFALVIAGVSTLGLVHLVTPGALLAALFAVAIGLALVRRDLRFAFPFRAMVARDTWPLVALGCGALLIAVLAARWLPIVHWDATWYHLPYVNFVLAAHGLDGVPEDFPFLSTYPHNGELFFVALRAMLPDDRLVDLGQIPFGVLGAIATAGIARLHGAERAHAAMAGCAWLLVPAVFLQLPGNYIDVACAAYFLAAVYFVCAPASPRTLVVAGIALGLYLGTKATAPLGTGVLMLVMVFRGLKAKFSKATWLSVALALAFGAPSYIDNLVHHGNPMWPVDFSAGPWHFSGPEPLSAIAEQGSLRGSQLPMLLRVPASWLALAARPVYDMRMGGFGALFLLALPFAFLTLLRARSAVWWIAVVATTAGPDPAYTRYVLAFPGVVLALAAPHLSRLRHGVDGGASGRLRSLQGRIAAGLVAALGVHELAYACQGLVPSGVVNRPPFLAFATMTDPQRARTVNSTDFGAAAHMLDAQNQVGPGESYAFDVSAVVNSYYAWASDLRYHVIWIPGDATPESAGEVLAREHVRVFMTGSGQPLGRWAARHPERVRLLFPCVGSECSVYEHISE